MSNSTILCNSLYILDFYENEKKQLKLDYCYYYQDSYLLDTPTSSEKCSSFCYSKILLGKH